MTRAPVTPARATESAVRRRIEGLARLHSAQFRRMFQLSGIGYFIAAASTLLAASRLGSPALGALVGAGVMAVTTAVAWRPLLRPDIRAAIELMSDHDCHESAEWRRETGTRVPIGVASMERWLTAHPSGPGRASILLRLGRLNEADRAIDAILPKTPEEAFGVEILRATRLLFAGQRPDVSPLRASWPSLPDPRERRHRRECLALLESQIAAADQHDPIPILASARREIEAVHPSMRIERLIVRWLVPGVALIVVASVVSAAVS
jgi:hypothetical protein